MLFASPRLTFRRWRPDDEALARLLWGDPEVTKLFTKEPLSDEEVIARLRRECAREQELGFQYWPMFAKAGGDLVGCCGFAPKDHDSGARHELGFHLRRAHWGVATPPRRRGRRWTTPSPSSAPP